MIIKDVLLKLKWLDFWSYRTRTSPRCSLWRIQTRKRGGGRTTIELVWSLRTSTVLAPVSAHFPSNKLTKFACLYSNQYTFGVISAMQKRKRNNREMIFTNFCPYPRSCCPIFRSRSCRPGKCQVKPDEYAIHVDYVMSGNTSTRFEHESFACLSLEFL